MDFETIGTLAAIITGMSALIISIIQGTETRKNNRLSVTPRISITGKWIKGAEPVGILLQNKGIGPAILEKIIIEIDESRIEVLSNPESFKASLKEILLEGGVGRYFYCLLSSGDIIATGEERLLVWLPDSSQNDPNIVKSFKESFSRINFQVEYKSIFGDRYVSRRFSTSNDIEGTAR